jgi:hypothetical protein
LSVSFIIPAIFQNAKFPRNDIDEPGGQGCYLLAVLRKLRRRHDPDRAEPIYVPLTPPEFTFDPEVLENAFRQHPKALILCNPSNPCAAKFRQEQRGKDL